MSAVITSAALMLKQVLIVEGFALDGTPGSAKRRFMVDAYFTDGSVLNLGIFDGLEKAAREAGKAAQDQCRVGLILQPEDRS